MSMYTTMRMFIIVVYIKYENCVICRNRVLYITNEMSLNSNLILISELNSNTLSRKEMPSTSLLVFVLLIAAAVESNINGRLQRQKVHENHPLCLY
jgi:hypothetical protein